VAFAGLRKWCEQLRHSSGLKDLLEEFALWTAPWTGFPLSDELDLRKRALPAPERRESEKRRKFSHKRPTRLLSRRTSRGSSWRAVAFRCPPVWRAGSARDDPSAGKSSGRLDPEQKYGNFQRFTVPESQLEPPCGISAGSVGAGGRLREAGNKRDEFAGTLAGATGLEPATSCVTGRS
jgi:hypothetical protein